MRVQNSLKEQKKIFQRNIKRAYTTEIDMNIFSNKPTVLELSRFFRMKGSPQQQGKSTFFRKSLLIDPNASFDNGQYYS